MRRDASFGLGLTAGVALCAVAAFALGWSAFQDGFSARARPTTLETMLARRLLHASVPAVYRALQNPVPATPGALHEAMEHFADHCASCHANDGSGETLYGGGLNPPPPDLRAAPTQAKSDGELYAAIANGIRMSGMPAFGQDERSSPGHDAETWKLVRLVRHLPQLTADEALAMKGMNPVTPGERKEQQEEDEFLNGSAPSTHKESHP